MVIRVAVVERHGGAYVLKRAKLLILGHHSGFLGVQDLYVSFQLSVSRLKSSVRKLTTSKVTSDLLLFLEAIQLVGDSCLLATLLI